VLIWHWKCVETVSKFQFCHIRKVACLARDVLFYSLSAICFTSCFASPCLQVAVGILVCWRRQIPVGFCWSCYVQDYQDPASCIVLQLLLKRRSAVLRPDSSRWVASTYRLSATVWRFAFQFVGNNKSHETSPSTCAHRVKNFWLKPESDKLIIGTAVLEMNRHFPHNIECEI